MKKKRNLFLSVFLTAALLLAGCAGAAGDGSQQDYQSRIDELTAQNRQLQEELDSLKAQLGMSGVSGNMVSENGADNHAVAESGTVSGSTVVPLHPADGGSEAEGQSAPKQTGQAKQENAEKASVADDGITKVVVFGDSIWDMNRESSGIASQVETYLGNAEVYNCAIGGTRATIPGTDETTGNDWASTSLGGMLNILRGTVDPSYLEGYVAENVIKQVKPEEMDYVIIAYGINDYFSGARLTSNDLLYDYHTYAGALRSGIRDAKAICPNAQILIIGPHYCRFFDKDGFMYADGNTRNTGSGTLSDYANVAQNVATTEGVLYIDAYNTMGINGYSADEYLDDGVHLTEAGRELYARAVSSCLKYGKPGEVSGNSIYY